MRSASEKFWAKVDRRGPDECWPFRVSPTQTQATFKVGRKGKYTVASRVMLKELGTPVPDDKVVCHRCDNPFCVNPAHLWIGTQKDNIRDMHAKGRAYNGKDRITHCPSGHEYTTANTRKYQGKRHCRACNREKHRRNADVWRSLSSARTKGVIQ